MQLTPPGSACSIAIGVGLTDAPPGSVRGMQIVVADVEAARAELLGRGVEASDVQEFAWGRFVFFATRTATAGRCSSSERGRVPEDPAPRGAWPGSRAR